MFTDPHFLNLHGHRYDYYGLGEHMAWRDDNYNEQVSSCGVRVLHAFTADCAGSQINTMFDMPRNWHASTTSGVAMRSGKDIIVWQVCGSYRKQGPRPTPRNTAESFVFSCLQGNTAASESRTTLHGLFAREHPRVRRGNDHGGTAFQMPKNNRAVQCF